MKKNLIFLLFLSVFFTINASSKDHTHHSKSYVHKKIQYSSDISEKQYKKAERLRVKFMEKERAVDRRIVKLRKEMNRCILHEENPERYKKLRKKMYSLREEKKVLREKFKTSYMKILEG